MNKWHLPTEFPGAPNQWDFQAFLNKVTVFSTEKSKTHWSFPRNADDGGQIVVGRCPGLIFDVSVKGWESHKFLMASQPTLPNDSPPRNSQPDDQDLIKIGFP